MKIQSAILRRTWIAFYMFLSGVAAMIVAILYLLGFDNTIMFIKLHFDDRLKNIKKKDS